MAMTINQESGTIAMTAAADKTSLGNEPIYVKTFRWVVSSGATGGEQLILDDSVTGAVVWETVNIGTDAEVVEETLVEKWFKNGITVDTIGAGTVYISYK